MIAVEFALVVPVLLALFLGGIDTAWLVIAHYKLERAADSVADLTARTQQLRPSDVQDIFAAATMVAKPFDLGADGRVIASSITNPTGTGAIVDWQQASTGGLSATSKIGTAGGTAQLGTDLTVELGETMIVGEAYLDFQPIIGFLIGSSGTLYPALRTRTLRRRRAASPNSRSRALSTHPGCRAGSGRRTGSPDIAARSESRPRTAHYALASRRSGAIRGVIPGAQERTSGTAAFGSIATARHASPEPLAKRRTQGG